MELFFNHLDKISENPPLAQVLINRGVVMNGGDGPNSYTHNSQTQGKVVDSAKALLSSSLHQKLIIEEHNSKVFTIADLGCSVGPNTFTCVTTMVEAVTNIFQTTLGCDQIPELHVFFNDSFANDFNTLFKNLPSDRHYMAAGVPGSFHGRLFPKASINMMHSSSSLQWLSKVPQQVTQKDSPAWNKGRITYVKSSFEVKEAYAAQFMEDMKAFFTARSVEMAKDGLLALNIPYRPDESEPKPLQRMEYCMGQALADMVEEGRISESLADGFNLPIYIPNVYEIKQVVSSIENLSIETMEEIHFPRNIKSPDDASHHVRAVWEGILRKHFDSELNVDELFERCTQKFYELWKLPQFTYMEEVDVLFLLVRCNSIDTH